MSRLLLMVAAAVAACGAYVALCWRWRSDELASPPATGPAPNSTVLPLTARAAPPRRYLGHLGALVAILAVAGAVLANGGLAVFTDSASVPGNSFTTGTVDISTSPTSALVTFNAMAPGDRVTAPLTVTNGGSLELRYAVSSTTTEDTLASELDLTIKSGVTTCTNAGFGSSGTVVYATGDLGSTTGVNVLGSPSQGAQAGDRTLAASASETLCFNVALPLSASNASQGMTTTATFAFAAEQTANNP